MYSTDSFQGSYNLKALQLWHQAESEGLVAEERFEVDQPTRLRVKFLQYLWWHYLGRLQISICMTSMVFWWDGSFRSSCVRTTFHLAKFWEA